MLLVADILQSHLPVVVLENQKNHLLVLLAVDIPENYQPVNQNFLQGVVVAVLDVHLHKNVIQWVVALL